MIPHVREVQALPDSKLRLTFDTSEVRIFDSGPYLSTGRFTRLQNEKLFAQARVAFGTVEWPNGLDFDPEDLYGLSTADPQSFTPDP